ncbi:GNAT family N-acetyltransferase [Pseudomonas sp. NPDC007930]|uniref:GNAT family N-acetyltransferase n=1 Tax=Pseudomonas sp. NPDC007930 TaxID=3364417 RepID=UPI0036E63039
MAPPSLRTARLWLTPPQAQQAGHIGYWLGAPYRGQGYMREATEAVLRYGFEDLALQRIHTACFAANAASARVLEGAGLQPEGCRRRAFRKGDTFHDLLLFGALREQWLAEPR